MPRRKSTASTPAASAKGHKRALSNNATPVASASSSRTSKRIKQSTEDTPTNGSATSKKSKYFEEPDSNDDGGGVGSDDTSQSGYDDNDDEDVNSTELSEQESESDDFDSEEDVKPKKKARRKPAALKDDFQHMGDDLWREGVKTGLGPGKQVFIAKPKPRDDGGVKYKPEKIHPNTMLFLADLKKNNDREWLKRHDPDYRQSWKDWESFVETLTEKIAEVDETVPELPPKDLVFRIYRDVRFSSDPTPYKPHFSAAWSRTGRKGPYAVYYVQIQPGKQSLVGGGLWHPEAEPLRLIRNSIDRRPERLKAVLMHDLIRKHIFDGTAKDEKKAVKAFCSQNSENALKTKPKGYDADHPDIDLLRLRNFTIGKRMPDSDITGANGLEKIMDVIKALFPFVTYLNSVVMPDEEEDDSDDDGEDEDEQDDTG